MPVDFSPASEQAFLHAGEYARQVAAPLLVLHVMHDAGDAPGAYRMEGEDGELLPMGDAAELLLERFADRMQEIAPELVEAVQPEYRLATGLPATRILEVAAHVDARLLVLGNRGAGGLSRLVMGSTADRVLKDAPMPVTLVKAADDGPR